MLCIQIIFNILEHVVGLEAEDIEGNHILEAIKLTLVGLERIVNMLNLLIQRVSMVIP